MNIMQAFLTDNFQIDDPYTADMLRLYSLIKAGIVNITYKEYEDMKERDVVYLTTIAETEAIANDVKNKERQFVTLNK
ncbi:MAG: hypothetical protein QW383_01975 [Candidatus Nitrosocaldus sp.]